MGAANYEIRSMGRLSDALLPAFEGLMVTTEPVETIMYGPLANQEAVHKLLHKLESLGLEVVEFRRLPGEAGDPRGAPPSPWLRQPADLDQLQTEQLDPGQDPR